MNCPMKDTTIPIKLWPQNLDMEVISRRHSCVFWNVAIGLFNISWNLKLFLITMMYFFLRFPADLSFWDLIRWSKIVNLPFFQTKVQKRKCCFKRTYTLVLFNTNSFWIKSSYIYFLLKKHLGSGFRNCCWWKE